MIILGVALSLILSLLLLYFHGRDTLDSDYQVSRLSFFSILFTTGLDGGLIFLPLLDFAKYADPSVYPELSFASPLVIEFGFWGLLSWLCYFVTVCYFAIYEPKLKVFDTPWVKVLNNGLIMLTCAFTAWLLYANLPDYLPGGWLSGQEYILNLIVILVITLAVISSARIRFIKILSVASVLLFILLTLSVSLLEQLTVARTMEYFIELSQYFVFVDKFLLPQNAYHEFYLYWWFAWSIMIGQFTAQFVKGLKVYTLLLAILILPSIPVAIWFVVLYDSFLVGGEFSNFIQLIFIVMGALFVVNSMDSLIRLYSINLGLNKEKLGYKTYHLIHIGLLFVITLLFDVKVLSIEFVGAVVLVLWLVAFFIYWHNRNRINVNYSDKTNASEGINK